MKQKDIFLILIPSFVIAVLWVIFSIYHNYVSSTISNPLSVQIQPIDASFNQRAIEDVKKRKQINPLYEVLVGSSSAEPTLEPTPESAEIIVSEEASESADQEGAIE